MSHKNTNLQTRLAVEELESRTCLTVGYGVYLQQGILNIGGTNSADHYQVTIDDATGRITVTGGGIYKQFAASQVKRIEVDLRGGDDSIEVKATSSYFYARGMSINLGDGFDIARLSFENSRLYSSTWDITLDAGAGNDDVMAAFGPHQPLTNTVAPMVTLTANLGSGDDYAAVSAYGNVDLGATRFSLYGQDGNDRLIGSAFADVLDGGAGNDVIYGGLGNDNLFGGSGVDYLYGEGGNDVLNGSNDATRDYLYGGMGNDTFYQNYAFLGAKPQDSIMDFQTGDYVYTPRRLVKA